MDFSVYNLEFKPHVQRLVNAIRKVSGNTEDNSLEGAYWWFTHMSSDIMYHGNSIPDNIEVSASLDDLVFENKNILNDIADEIRSRGNTDLALDNLSVYQMALIIENMTSRNYYIADSVTENYWESSLDYIPPLTLRIYNIPDEPIELTTDSYGHMPDYNYKSSVLQVPCIDNKGNKISRTGERTVSVKIDTESIFDSTGSFVASYKIKLVVSDEVVSYGFPVDNEEIFSPVYVELGTYDYVNGEFKVLRTVRLGWNSTGIKD